MPNRSARQGILVGVDGSASSTVAVRWAAREAVMRNVALTIVHVLPIPLEGWTDVGYMPATGVGPRQDKKGQQIIDDATRIVQNATKDSGPVQINSEMFFSPPRFWCSTGWATKACRAATPTTCPPTGSRP
jgi:nucleotide-binding universal stress UspA family protein